MELPLIRGRAWGHHPRDLQAGAKPGLIHSLPLEEGLGGCRGSWIAERVPLLHQVDPQHGGLRVRRPYAHLGRYILVVFGQQGSISSISACKGTTGSISARNFSRLVRFLAVLCS